MEFKNLHDQDKPLLIGNVWDVPSAKTAERLNFQAIATSSYAMAALLGYRDGEEMAFSEVEYLVKRIRSNTQLPLSVDLESGYSRHPKEIANHIKRLAELGVVGINFEDSVVENKRSLLDAVEFSKTLSAVKEILLNERVEVFINVRTDAFLMNHPNPVEESIKRIQLYENAGANGIFTPCIVKGTDINVIVKCTHLPINVLCMPNLPDFATLAQLGVKRISMGNFLFNKMYEQFEHSLAAVVKQESFHSIF